MVEGILHINAQPVMVLEDLLLHIHKQRLAHAHHVMVQALLRVMIVTIMDIIHVHNVMVLLEKSVVLHVMEQDV
jgi:hypothetical protein